MICSYVYTSLLKVHKAGFLIVVVGSGGTALFNRYKFIILIYFPDLTSI